MSKHMNAPGGIIMHASHAPSMDDVSAHARDYLVFRLGRREYGIALDQVQELRSYDAVRISRDGASITAGADPSGVIAGSVRLGEADVAVADLGVLLCQPGPALRDGADIVIVRCGQRVAAVAVDSVIDVITLMPGQVRDAAGALHVAGVGAVDDSGGRREVSLLDVDRLVSALHSSSTQLAA
jgi:purine-binding chemotaxis protein CheW